MFRRVIIILVGAGFAGDCIATAVLTIIGINPATLHLTKFFMIGYAAISAVLTPFGISGVIGAVSRKKTLIRAFVTFQWWLATFVLIGLNVFNVVLSKRGKGDFINRCQADLAKSQPNSDSDFLDRCTAKANDAENATFIATCAQGGIMLFVGIIILIVGTREYNNISLEEETKNLLAKANFNEDVETSELRNLSPQTSNFNNNASESRNVNNIGGDDLVRRVTNVKRQPTKAATINVDLERHQTNTNMNSAQNSGLRRNLTDPTGRNQTDINVTTPLYRSPTLPGNIPPKRVGRYPPNANDIPVNVTRQPTVGNAYAPRNYADAQATYPPPQFSPTFSPTKQYMNPPQLSPTKQYINPPQLSPTKQYMNPPQRSLSTKQYMNPPQGSLPPTNQYINPPPQRYLSTKQYMNQPLPPLPPPQMKLPPPPPPDVNEYSNNYRPPKPYKQQTMPPYYMGTNQ